MTEPVEAREPLTAALIAQAHDLTEVAKELGRQARTTRWLKIAIVLILVAAGVGAYFAVQIRHNQKNTKEVLETVQDCTDPEGDCYRRSVEQQANAIVQLNAKTQQIVVAAAACAKVPENVTEAQIRVCVEAKVK